MSPRSNEFDRYRRGGSSISGAASGTGSAGGCGLAAAAHSDHLADAIDYRTLFAKCEEVITKRSHALLEALAYACLDEVLEDTRIKRATIRIRKPRALEGATPEVELTRGQA